MDEIVVCPACGKSDDIQAFDVLGACAGNVFCTDCSAEFNPDTREIHECNELCQEWEPTNAQ